MGLMTNHFLLARNELPLKLQVPVVQVPDLPA